MNRSELVRCALMLGTAAMVSACVAAGPPRLDDPTARAGSRTPTPMPLALPQRERALLGGRRVDWGLALSGGGLRSALFSFGVLKGLYDRRLLDEIDVISTVSGGGYTGYWLYANELAAPGERFGAYSLADESFAKRMCELETTGNFVTYPQLARTISPNLSERAVKLYERSLVRTFGLRDPRTAPLTIERLGPLVASQRAPLIVQNATIKSTSADPSPWPERLIEFTPLGYGSNELGFVGWGSQPGTGTPTLTKTTAVSGAAFPPLDQTIPLRHPATGDPTMALTDGGKSENLGAVALIRRGLPNIIVADAEHDPGYIFHAYRQLRLGLQQYGLTLSIRSIDNYLLSARSRPFSEAVAIGTVTRAGSGTPVSTIYYIKANLSDELAPVLTEQADPGGEGAVADRRFRDAMVATRRKRSRDWICADLAGMSLPTGKWAAWSVASYSGWLRRAWKPKAMRILSNATRFADIRIEFPQYSTGDQSFANDQAEAFFGLGYLQATRLPAPVGPREAP